ncbi:MAG: sigma-54-dependent Fis family transcriptional regulator, partial [Verrucomicrobia bacterium]|nr:sigma-54-dependent Fis family transcriptional regulator [Verrucomicrobiota bacterium]
SLRKQAEEAPESARAALSLADERLSFFTEQEAKRWGIQGFIGQSPALGLVVEQVRKVQQSDSISVLITGESGVGKELIARAIHFGGGRSKGPFVPINCASIPRELAESLLFGHTKGSFSGAMKDHKGYFEMAEGGTLFLDELGELPMDIQVKFLRVLEDGLLLPVGATRPVKSNVRIISATHQSLSDEVEAGRFRKDLYYRMTPFTIHVPSLRDRLEDIPSLAEHFLAHFSSEMGRSRPQLSSEALNKLVEHDFPGNIRELKNVIERAAIECDGEVVQGRNILISGRRHNKSKPVQDITSQRHQTLQVLSNDEQSILDQIESHGPMSNRQCRELLGVDIHRANYLLNKLTKMGHLQRAGSNRNSVYVKLTMP